MNGCDISSFQGAVDFDLLAKEVGFVIIKATEGAGFKDPAFDHNWDKARAAGLIRGAYHFARPDLGLSAEEESGHFIASLGPLDPFDLLALDYEVNWDGAVVAWCKDFLDEVRLATGIVPFIYLNLSYFKPRRRSDGTLVTLDWSPVVSAGYPLWLADYDGRPDIVPQTPWSSVAMKQWTSSGSVSGITGRVDLDTWLEFEEEDMALRAEFETFKRDTEATLETMKKTYNPLYHHVHLPATVNITVSSEPLVPPVDGALYAGSSADLTQVFWKYTDGTVHNWVNGKEVTV